MRGRQVVILSLITLAFVGGVLFLVVRYTSQHPDQANLGSEVIRLDAERTASRIAETGPYPLQDPHGDRDVYLQHVGADPSTGWVLVLWYPPGETCPVKWEPQRRLFRSCSGRAYPADGSGLTTYQVPVENGRVVIDLRGG